MRLALLTTFVASKKEPLAAMMERIRQAFLDAGLGEPAIRFNFSDAPLAGYVSSVDRVLKRFPDLERFVTTADPLPGIPGRRRISNGPVSPAAGDTLPYATLAAIAAGVPRSFPFHGVSLHLHSPEFGALLPTHLSMGQILAGVLLADSWWINGRNRALSACTVVEADPGSKKLPEPPGRVAAVLAACGKVKKTVQAPLVAPVDMAALPGIRLPGGGMIPSADPKAALAVRDIVLDYRARLQEVVKRAALPYDLPREGVPLGTNSGPRKPALERAFKPMGYTCRGESGTFTLRRRTPGNLSAELSLDVGTWGRSVLAFFHVFGVGFKATLGIPVSPQAILHAQYPIGDAGRWEKIVENLAAMVAELDRTFVPEIEAAAGPSPDWYQPES